MQKYVTKAAGSRFKWHPVYQARFGPPSPHGGTEAWTSYSLKLNKPISAWINLKISRFVVRLTVIDKTSNFALNLTRMQQAHYIRHILHAEKITGRPEGGGNIAPCPPPKYATGNNALDTNQDERRSR